MKEYKIIINNQEFIIKQDVDGKFIKPDFIKEYEKVGSALKPSFEPIIVARKPFKGSLVDNVIKYGVGGINIDECRVETSDNLNGGAYSKGSYSTEDTVYKLGTKRLEGEYKQPEGRFPANTILTYDETDFDEVCGGFPYTKNGGQNETSHRETWFRQETTPTRFAGDSGSASRYFYCAKASKKDRDEGLENFEIKGAKELLNREENSDGASWNGKYSSGNAFAGSGAPKRNNHPTVKPTELMQYLVRLVSPKHSTILDPFMGSGSTGKAVAYENNERNMDYKFIGVELDSTYMNIAKARILYADGNKISIETNVENNIEEVVVTKKPKQQRLF